MINLKQKDSVADAVKAVMQQEEKHLSPKQKKIAKMAGDPEKIDAADLAALRAGKKPVKEENVEESSNPFSKDYKSQIPTKPGEKAGFDSKKISTGTVYSKKHKPEPAEKETTKEDFSYFKDKLVESLFEEEVVDDLINEVLSKDASAGDWIHDFVHSDNPKFKGKSKAMRKKMALAAYYAKQRNEEVEQIEENFKPGDFVKDVVHGQIHRVHKVEGNNLVVNKRHGKDSYGTFTNLHKTKARKVETPTNEEVEQIEENDFLKNVKKRVAQRNADKYAHYSKQDAAKGRQASADLYAKASKHAAKQANEEVEITEGKHPESDTVPFVTDDSKPLANAKNVAAKSLKRMKNEMMGKTGTSE